MTQGIKDLFPVAVYFSETAVNTPWKQMAWNLDGVLAAKKTGRSQVQQQIYTSTGKGHQVIRWEGLQVRLDRRSCSAYYDNLLSSDPKIFVICHGDSQEMPTPFLVTFDLSETEAYMEAGEEIYSSSLVPELYFPLEQFVLENYVPELPKKRRRKS
jgi:hypothetical protein